MNDNQVQLLIRSAGFLRISLRYCLLIQGMEYGDTGKLRYTGISCHRCKLVNHNRVNDVRRLADLVADLSCQNTAKVGSMLSGDTGLQILKQSICHSVGTAGDGL